MEETSDPDLLIPDEEESSATSGTPASTSSPIPSSGAVVLSTSATIDSPAYSSGVSGENALKLISGSYTLTSGSINKSGPASDSTLVNAAVWVQNASLNLTGTTLTSTADAAPAFALAQPNSDNPEASATLILNNVHTDVASGDTFLVANTSADLTLSGSTFINRDPASNFLRAEASDLGDYGINGGIARVSLINQVAEGNITADSLSSVSLTLTQSYYMGALNPSASARAFSLTLDATSNLILAGDSYLTELINSDPENLNIYSNGFKLVVAGEEVQINGSEAPALPETEKKTEDQPEETKTTTQTTQFVRDKCGPKSRTQDCASSRPSIIFFIVGGILVALAIVIPILLVHKHKGKTKWKK